MSIEKHILIVDDELEIRKIIQEILKDEGYSTSTASSAKEARAEVKNKKPDLVFLDIWMPEEDGISLLKDWTSQPETDFPVIMISGHATIETAIEATKLGAKDFIEKPVSIEKLLASAQEFLAQSIIGEDIFSICKTHQHLKKHWKLIFSLNKTIFLYSKQKKEQRKPHGLEHYI